ncbi:hypothetical protein [Oricola cellulosilytica]|uniref:Uncharacterized protein n=1 Tax=Oricola cellulosilytica TaxID=1429082 RepID=A0A4R0PEY5_9HYPH|nr:hypothetical protein [Oricola cellulosilytica]TCD15343.1 hypothetical protein E0D97_07365 [Oricola cellulosilytica]
MLPPKPPRSVVGRQLDKSRKIAASRKDSFVRETYRLGRPAAREKAKEWFNRFPKAAYWTQVESWRVLDGDVIEFTMRRLPTAD